MCMKIIVIGLTCRQGYKSGTPLQSFVNYLSLSLFLRVINITITYFRRLIDLEFCQVNYIYINVFNVGD